MLLPRTDTGRTRKENSTHLTGKERGSMNPTVSKMRCGPRSNPPWSHCSPSAHVWNTCSTLSAQPDQQGNLPSDTAVHYTQTRCVNSPWQEHNWRDKGEEAVNPFPGWGSPCSTSTRELLQHCSGVQNSAPVSTAEQDAALSHLCQVYFSFRCEEGDKVSIYWIWGTSCQHSCSAKWLHVQGNPSASGWDLQPFVPFSLGLYSFLQWSEDRSQRLNNCFPVLAHSKSTDSLHFFLLLHFAFTDELLSLVINLKTLVRWGSLNLNNHLKFRSPRDRCTRKIFSVCLSWAWLLNSSLQFSFL